jgi:hypothetical protein
MFNLYFINYIYRYEICEECARADHDPTLSLEVGQLCLSLPF